MKSSKLILKTVFERYQCTASYDSSQLDSKALNLRTLHINKMNVSNKIAMKMLTLRICEYML